MYLRGGLQKGCLNLYRTDTLNRRRRDGPSPWRTTTPTGDVSNDSKEAGARTGHGLALAAVAAALIATPDPAGAQEREADLLGTVGAWTVGISVNGGEVSYALTRRDYRLPVFRLSCLPDGEWAAATMTDLRYGWLPSENLRQGSVWTRFDGGPESLQGAAVDDYGGCSGDSL